jgi:hypothetical protein
VAAPPSAWPAGQAAGRPSAAEEQQDDLTRSDWWGAEQRRAGDFGDFGEPPGPGSSHAQNQAEYLTGVPDLSLTTTNAALVSSATEPVAAAPPRRRSWVQLTRLWALAKVASMAYTTWWAMGYAHASPGTIVSAYGAVCLFAGFGARWRKRFFGPGQLIEPEVYEEIGRWLYRLGVVLVLVGGVAVTAQYLSH